LSESAAHFMHLAGRTTSPKYQRVRWMYLLSHVKCCGCGPLC